MRRHREYKNASKDLPTKIVYKYIKQLYTVVVNDIKVGERILIRENLPVNEAYEAFFGFIKHFEVVGEMRKTRRIKSVKDKNYSVKLKKQRRRRLL
jgi:hypothetical protein